MGRIIQAGIRENVTRGAHTMSMSRTVSSPPQGSHQSPNVIAINDDAASYLILAEAIQGAAVGLSAEAQEVLRRGLKDRFGPIFSARGEDAVDELLKLATEPKAA